MYFIFNSENSGFSTNSELSSLHNLELLERALSFSDGAFETILVENGLIKNFSRHISRLVAGLDYLHFNIDAFQKDIKNLELWLSNIIVKSNTNGNVSSGTDHVSSERFLVRLSVVRGGGTTGYTPSSDKMIVFAKVIHKKLGFDERDERDYNLYVSGYSSLQGIKCSSKIMQKSVLYTPAKIESEKLGCDDALILARGNTEDALESYVSEAGSANIIYSNGNTLYTPSLRSGCIAGIVREILLEKGLIKERDCTLRELLECTNVYVCNVWRGVAKVKSITTKGHAKKIFSTDDCSELNLLNSVLQNCSTDTNIFS